MRIAAQQVKAASFDACYILPNSFRSALVPMMAGISSRVGTGLGGRAFLLTEKVDFPADVKAQHQQYENAWVLGLRDIAEALPPPVLDVSAVENPLPALGCTEPSTIGLIPSAARGPSKEWPQQNFIEVAKAVLAESGRMIVLLGTPDDRALCASIAEAVNRPDRVVNAAGATDMARFAAAIKACSLIVANDSGGMHLAAALGVPVIGLFGLTNPKQTGPLGRSATVLQASNEETSRTIGRDSEAARIALARIKPKEVIAHIESILSS